MRQPAAKHGDQIVPSIPHTHFMVVPGSPSPVPIPHPCVWEISENLSSNVNIEGQPAAIAGSGGNNSGAKAHKPLPPGTAFATPPPTMDRSKITSGSGTVRINGKSAARSGDVCTTCNEPVNALSGIVVATSTVWIGG